MIVDGSPYDGRMTGRKKHADRKREQAHKEE